MIRQFPAQHTTREIARTASSFVMLPVEDLAGWQERGGALKTR